MAEVSLNTILFSKKKGRFFYTYILLCSDKKSYIGSTDDLPDRVERHNKGYVPATKDRRPLKLQCYFAFADKYIAFNFEQYLKSGSGRAFLKKHQLI